MFQASDFQTGTLSNSQAVFHMSEKFIRVIQTEIILNTVMSFLSCNRDVEGAKGVFDIMRWVVLISILFFVIFYNNNIDYSTITVRHYHSINV